MGSARGDAEVATESKADVDGDVKSWAGRSSMGLDRLQRAVAAVSEAGWLVRPPTSVDGATGMEFLMDDGERVVAGASVGTVAAARLEASVAGGEYGVVVVEGLPGSVLVQVREAVQGLFTAV